MSVSLLQTISPEKLGCIQGLGEKRLQAIITYRNKHQLNSLEDLLNVKGIGKSTLKNIREYKTKKKCTTFNQERDKPTKVNESKRKEISAK
jgi:competence ComEA-like helix-hairpin-helix protein